MGTFFESIQRLIAAILRLLGLGKRPVVSAELMGTQKGGGAAGQQ